MKDKEKLKKQLKKEITALIEFMDLLFDEERDTPMSYHDLRNDLVRYHDKLKRPRIIFVGGYIMTDYSEEDLDLGIDKLKANKAAASAKPSEPEKTDVSPLTEEKERHKKNLM